MLFLRKLPKAQQIFLYVAVAFLLLVFSILFIRSKDRKSLLSTEAILEGDTSVGVQSGGGQDTSKFRLQDFHRVEVKEGKKIWEISAKNADFFPAEGITHVNDASISIFKEDGSTFYLNTKVAKLYMSGSSLQKAELEGEVHVDTKGLMITTEFATYDSAQSVVTSPAKVLIKGEGYQLDGVGLRFDIQTEQLDLNSNVHSSFTAGGKVPGLLKSRKVSRE